MTTIKTKEEQRLILSDEIDRFETYNANLVGAFDNIEEALEILTNGDVEFNLNIVYAESFVDARRLMFKLHSLILENQKLIKDQVETYKEF